LTLVLVDSSAFLSLEDPSEKSHKESKEAFQRLLDKKTSFLCTNFVFDETYTLILSRLGRARAVAWGEGLLGSKLIHLFRLQEDHEQEAWQIILDFSDKDFSYTDATSFAVALSFGIDEVMSLDEHFHQFGRFRVLP
jgi:predicted nucleic acid-binding protein